MPDRKEINEQIGEVLVEGAPMGEFKEIIIQEYKELSEKCDLVIAKIKNRKEKKIAEVAEVK